MLKYDGEVVSSTTMKDVNLSFYEKDVDLSVYRQDAGFTIWCSCDGIVCFEDYDGNVIIANSGIRQYQALPNSCIPLPKAEAWGEYSTETQALGLGIESSYWNGAYYWCASEGSKIMDGMCSSNLTDEEFQFISVPKYIFLFPNDSSDFRCGIIEFNGALALITHYGSEIGCYFDVWVVDDGCLVGGTWTKLLSTTKPLLTDFEVDAPLSLLNKDQLIFIILSGQPASYSFATNQVKILPINRESRCYNTATYKTSLVQIDK